MKYRKLQIAWSVVWGILAMLLIALWVRSRFGFDRAGINLYGNRTLILISQLGQLSAVVVYYHPSINSGGYDSGPLVPIRTDLADIGWPGRTVAGFGWISRMGYNYVPNYPVEDRWRNLNLRERSWTSTASGLVVPTWSLPLVLICVAASVWIGHSPSIRFSLRTLLIVTTLVAVSLGLIVWLW